MVTLTLGDKEATIPTDLTLDQWCQVVKWDVFDQDNWSRILSIVTGLPKEEFDLADPKSQELGIIFISHSLSRRKETQHKDFNDMKFGEWVDLDIYISQGLEKSIKDVLRVLGAETTSASEALYVIDKYNHWRTYILRTFSYLFDYDENTSGDTESDVNWKEVGQSWYRIIVGLANDNLLDLDKVTDEPVRKVFQFMTLQKQKNQEEQMKQLKAKHDLQRNRR